MSEPWCHIYNATNVSPRDNSRYKRTIRECVEGVMIWSLVVGAIYIKVLCDREKPS